MYALNRRGFTLVELLVAIMLTAVVTGAVVQVLVTTQRVSNAGMQQLNVQQNLRAGLTYFNATMRELDAGEGDIALAMPTQLRFRSMRWAGVMCAVPVPGVGPAVVVPLRRDAFFGLRGPDAAEDSVAVFRDGDPGNRIDDIWLLGAVQSVTATLCPDGTAGSNLTLTISAASGGQPAALTGVTAGSPIRGFQQEELSLFSAVDGRWYMGQRTANRGGLWGPVRRLVGPVTTAGLALEYYDRLGVATATLTDIASVGIILRGESDGLVRRGATATYLSDSLLTRVALRNNPRF